MSIHWMFVEDSRASEVVGKIGYVEIPEKVRYAPYFGGFAEGIAKDSKHSDVAFEYLKWLNQLKQ